MENWLVAVVRQRGTPEVEAPFRGHIEIVRLKG
jgi:hypothetical protein